MNEMVWPRNTKRREPHCENNTHHLGREKRKGKTTPDMDVNSGKRLEDTKPRKNDSQGQAILETHD